MNDEARDIFLSMTTKHVILYWTTTRGFENAKKLMPFLFPNGGEDQIVICKIVNSVAPSEPSVRVDMEHETVSYAPLSTYKSTYESRAVYISLDGV